MGSCPEAVPDNLAVGMEAVVRWLKQSWVKLNPSKTEVLWLGRATLVWDANSQPLMAPLNSSIDCQEPGHNSGCLPVNGVPDHKCYQAGLFESLPKLATGSLLVRP